MKVSLRKAIEEYKEAYRLVFDRYPVIDPTMTVRELIGHARIYRASYENKQQGE